MLDKKLRIGITIGLHQPNETLWNNGIKQNAVFLCEALRSCPSVAETFLVNTTEVAITSALPWDQKRWPVFTFEQVKDHVDVMIELGGAIGEEMTRYIKQRGSKLVSYCCGFEYVHVMEAMLFGKRMWPSGLYINQHYDDIWMIPQVVRNSQPFFEVLRRQQARVVPFVWSPMLFEQRTKHLPNQGAYQPRKGPKRLVVMEPNINVVKFCLYPILIAELGYRKAPHDIERLFVTNAYDLATKNQDFIALMNQLDIVKGGKAVFLDRRETPVFLAESADVVLSHQWDNPLNYFYLEACWQGYPLIHNAHLCAELGYFYEENNLSQAAEQLISVIKQHDENAEAYRQRQQGLLKRFLPTDSALVSSYELLLKNLTQKKIA